MVRGDGDIEGPQEQGRIYKGQVLGVPVFRDMRRVEQGEGRVRDRRHLGVRPGVLPYGHGDRNTGSYDGNLMENKNLVIIGAGYGGIAAAFRLEKLLRKSPGFEVYLIDKNPYHTIKTRLHEAAVLSTDVSIPIKSLIRKRKITFHLDEVTGIDPD